MTTRTDQPAIGVDVGGTKLAFALVSRAGDILGTHRLSTEATAGTDAVLDRIAQGVHTLRQQADGTIAGVGVGCPGHVDPVAGVVRDAVNLGWTEVQLVRDLTARLDGASPVWLAKDTNASAVGEMVYGAAQGCTDFVYLSVGTGLGGGAIVDGRLVQGGNNMAMEIGHIPLNPGGRPCVCGLHGCPETYASGKGLLASVLELRADHPDSPLAAMNNLIPADVLDAARADDSLAAAAIEVMVLHLSAVMVACGGVLNPRRFVLGGGLGHAAADLLLPGLEREFFRRTVTATHDGVSIVLSEVQNSAVGAAALVWQGDASGA